MTHLILVLSLALGHSGAGDSLYGAVHDSAGAPLRNAAVILDDLGRQTRTDDSGRYLLTDLPRGALHVTVRRLGYLPQFRVVTLPTAGPTDFTLTPAPVVLPAVTLTATRQAQDPRVLPMATATLDEQELRRIPDVSLAHAVERLPGVRTLSTGGQIGKPVIRGLSGSRVLVLDNGSRLEDQSWSDEDGPSVDVRTASRIEVIRGPASVLYGSEALGGIVNAVPAPLPATAGPGYTRGEVDLNAATNNADLGLTTTLEGAQGAFGWRAIGIGRHAASLHTPNGELDNTGYNAINGEVMGGVRTGGGITTLRVARYGGEFKLLEANGPPPGTTGAADQGPERKLADYRAQLDGIYPTALGLLELKGQWQQHNLAEVSDELGGTPGQEATVFDLHLATVTGDVLLHHSLARSLRGTAGVSATALKNRTLGELPIVPDARSTGLAGFLFEEYTSGRWQLQGGARYDRIRIRSDSAGAGGSAVERTFDQAAVSAGIAYQLTPALLLRADGGRGWRAPSFFELFTNGPLLAEEQYQIGDPNLAAEYGWNAEVGARVAAGPLTLDGWGFRYTLRNFVFLQPTTDTIQGFQVFRQIQAPATLQGAELTASLRIGGGWGIREEFDMVRGSRTDTGVPLPRTPPARLQSALEWHRDALGWADRAYAALSADAVWPQHRTAPNETGTAGYVLIGFEGGVRPHLLGDAVEFDLRVLNLGNQRYRSFLSRYRSFALNPGRDIQARIALEF